MTATDKPAYRLGDIPVGVWTLGFVSLLMDASSETIHALLPIYLVTVLGTSATISLDGGAPSAAALYRGVALGP